METAHFLRPIPRKSTLSLPPYSMGQATTECRGRGEDINSMENAKRITAPARWLSWLEHRRTHQWVGGLLPSQGTYLGGRFDPWSGHIGEATDRYFSLTSMFLSLSYPLLKISNKNILGEYLKKRIMEPCFNTTPTHLQSKAFGWYSFYLSVFSFCLTEHFSFLRFFKFIFRERKREGEEEGEKRQSVAYPICPVRGPNPQHRHVPWPGIKMGTFRFAGQHPTNWATPVRAWAFSLLQICFSTVWEILSCYMWL